MIKTCKQLKELLQDKERELEKWRQNELQLIEKEVDLSKMAENLVQLSLTLDNEYRRVVSLETQIKCIQEAHIVKARELDTLAEEAQKVKGDRECALDIMQREAKGREQLTTQLAEQEEFINHQGQATAELTTSVKQRDEVHDCQGSSLMQIENLVADNTYLIQEAKSRGLTVPQMQTYSEGNSVGDLSIDRISLIEHLNSTGAQRQAKRKGLETEAVELKESALKAKTTKPDFCENETSTSDLMSKVEVDRTLRNNDLHQNELGCDLMQAQIHVDLLGDEVESLVTMVEKVYKVLDHHGVIPHPGVLVVKLNPML
ncbi:unnamed protein product [Sphagnum jensenii]|uniref:Uncharacterized protein n=1 Tax=Sphagnum jensenii TaxID=128206 RepID=A0ABP1AHB2_9BRYO